MFLMISEKFDNLIRPTILTETLKLIYLATLTDGQLQLLVTPTIFPSRPLCPARLFFHGINKVQDVLIETHSS